MIPKDGIFGPLTHRDYRLTTIVAGFTVFTVECIPSNMIRGILGILGLLVAGLMILNQINRVNMGKDPSDPNL